MNNNDLYQLEKDPRKRALLAIGFSKGKSSKAGAWAWALDAVRDAEAAGIENARDLLGNLSYPDFDALEKALNNLGNNLSVNNIINLTPHALTVYQSPMDDNPLIIPPGGLARCAEEKTILPSLKVVGVEFPVICKTFGPVTGLPEPKAGTVYIVSMLVAQQVSGRSDVVFPGDAIRDKYGNIIGCVGFSRMA